MTDRLIYTGVGSRDTPRDICRLMTRFASVMEDKGFWLRSGGAEGADQAFEKGAGHRKMIYIPWEGYNEYFGTGSQIGIWAIPEEASRIAMRHHPKWFSLSPTIRKLHARNVCQVLGLDLNKPSKFLICWTRDGCTGHDTRSVVTGGTGTAICVAEEFGVPVLNLFRKDHLRRAAEMLYDNAA